MSTSTHLRCIQENSLPPSCCFSAVAGAPPPTSTRWRASHRSFGTGGGRAAGRGRGVRGLRPFTSSRADTGGELERRRIVATFPDHRATLRYRCLADRCYLHVAPSRSSPWEAVLVSSADCLRRARRGAPRLGRARRGRRWFVVGNALIGGLVGAEVPLLMTLLQCGWRGRGPPMPDAPLANPNAADHLRVGRRAGSHSCCCRS